MIRYRLKNRTMDLITALGRIAARAACLIDELLMSLAIARILGYPNRSSLSF